MGFAALLSRLWPMSWSNLLPAHVESGSFLVTPDLNLERYRFSSARDFDESPLVRVRIPHSTAQELQKYSIPSLKTYPKRVPTDDLSLKSVRGLLLLHTLIWFGCFHATMP
jgi:hypothetical protein